MLIIKSTFSVMIHKPWFMYSFVIGSIVVVRLMLYIFMELAIKRADRKDKVLKSDILRVDSNFIRTMNNRS